MKYKTIREYILANYREDIEDIAEYGCANGFGPIYYYQTYKIYEEFKDEIWELIEQDYKIFGYNSSLEFIASLNGAEDVFSSYSLEGLLCYYALERTAKELVNDGILKKEEIINK